MEFYPQRSLRLRGDELIAKPRSRNEELKTRNHGVVE